MNWFLIGLKIQSKHLGLRSVVRAVLFGLKGTFVTWKNVPRFIFFDKFFQKETTFLI